MKLLDKCSSGFSLVELMTTVAIVAIVSAIGYPFLRNIFITPRGSDQVEMLKGAISALRNNVITADVCGVVTVTSANTISTQVFRDCGPPLAVPLPASTFTFNDLQISNFTSGASLTFIRGGGTNQVNPTEMTVTTNSGSQFRITILPAIGAMRINKLN